MTDYAPLPVIGYHFKDLNQYSAEVQITSEDSAWEYVHKTSKLNKVMNPNILKDKLNAPELISEPETVIAN